MAFTKKITNKITCETIKENLLTGQIYSNEKEEDSDSQRAIANRLTSQQAL
jgi:hypothetical protein